jgi:glycosyltransferase involved in cell wall biosynthesis
LKPDIVDTHQAKAGTLARIAVGQSGHRCAVVHTFHGHVMEGYFGAFSRSVFLTIERRLARRTDVLIAVSDEVRDELLGLGIGDESRWRVVPLGFDLKPFLQIDEHNDAVRGPLGLSDDVPLVGVFGRLAGIKDHATLLDAVASLEGVHLAIFGDGEMRNELERRTASLGVTSRVHFMGWWPDVSSAIADMDVVALTSRNEGTPVSLIEALASGRPVVSTDVGGVRAVVQDGRSGYLVPPASSPAVASSLERLIEDEEGRHEMGRAGRAWVIEHFTEERLIEDMRALYLSILKAK